MPAMIKRSDPGVRLPVWKSQFGHLLPLCPWADYSSCSHSHNCKFKSTYLPELSWQLHEIKYVKFLQRCLSLNKSLGQVYCAVAGTVVIVIETMSILQQTALHWSAYYNNPEHVKLLIKHDSNIGIPDVEGKIPLHWAANHKDPSAVHTVRCLLVSTSGAARSDGLSKNSSLWNIQYIQKHTYDTQANFEAKDSTNMWIHHTRNRTIWISLFKTTQRLPKCQFPNAFSPLIPCSSMFPNNYRPEFIFIIPWLYFLLVLIK